MPAAIDTSSEHDFVEQKEEEKVDLSEMSFKDRLSYRFSKFIRSTSRFIYNSEQQTILGTTSTNWLKISLYYLCFYICLGLFYCGMVAVFGAIISRQSPRYLYHNSEMNDHGKCHVGMGFRPMAEVDDTSITVYSDAASQNEAVSSLENYRDKFLEQNDLTYVDECSPTQPASTLRGGHACMFSWKDVVPNEAHPCSNTSRYGWPAGKPCILVKLNQIYGWVPAQGDMTTQVANWTNSPVLSVDAAAQNIYITCNGVEPADREVLGDLMYYSILHPFGNAHYGGIPYYFFPYRNSREHVQPFVLVQFMSLPLERLIYVECRAWAPNIEQSSRGTNRRGMTTFTLFRANRTHPSKA